ncbi:MAG: hypothetical protein WC850_04805 [Candidatus Gracilibacteria bacterium]|jgi:hypothetical protein
MKTLKIFLIFFLLNFLLFSCSVTKKTEEQKKIDTQTGVNIQTPISQNTTKTVQNLPSVEDSISKIGTKLKEEPVYRECIARSVEMCELRVISYFTQEKDSDQSCNIFEDASLKKSCINAINTELARKKVDSSFCDKVDTENQKTCKQQVITAKAIKEKDVKICEKLKIPDTDIKTNSGIMMPNEINNQDLQCIMQVVMILEPTEENLKICNTISNDMIKQRCNSMIKSRINEQKNMPIPPPDILPLVK